MFISVKYKIRCFECFSFMNLRRLPLDIENKLKQLFFLSNIFNYVQKFGLFGLNIVITS